MLNQFNRIFPSGAEHLVYICSISDFIPFVWNDTSQLKMSARNGTSTTKPVYVWNMHLLANSIQSNLSAGNSKLLEWAYVDNTDIFFPIWCKEKSTNGGSPISRLPTHFTVNTFNTFNSNKNFFSSEITFHPLINADPVFQYSYSNSTNDNQVQQSFLYGDTISYQAESIVWQSMVVPALPICITDSYPNSADFGPLFAENINITTSGIDSPVTIGAKYAGSKALLMPVIGINYGDNGDGGISYFKGEYPPLITRDAPFQDISVDNTGDSTNSTSGSDVFGNSTLTIDEYEPYRVANIRDCMILWQEATNNVISPWLNFNDVQNAWENSVWFDDNGFLTIKIKKISLNVQQSLEFTATSDEGRKAAFGPKYVAIGERNVTGTIEMFMPEDIYNRTLGIRFPSYALAMYFGGAFLFIMPNVDFQDPSVTVTTSGVSIVLNFIARAVPGAATTVPYNFFIDNLQVSNFSEFLILSDIITPPQSNDSGENNA
jgi:hypothetical protein